MFYKTFADACDAAYRRSLHVLNKDCGIYVNAWVTLKAGDDVLLQYITSDWYVSGQTLVTYINGVRK